MELLLSIFKFAGISLTGLFAVLGLLVEYRDKNGNVTKWGRIALVGALASTIVALSAQYAEQRKDRQTAIDNAQRTEDELKRQSTLLNQISRTLQPLHDIQLTYFISVDSDATEFMSFKQKMKSGVDAFLKRFPTWDSVPAFPSESLGFARSTGSESKIIELRVIQASEFMPQPKSAPLAYSLLTFRPHVCMRKLPKYPPEQCTFWSSDSDLRFLTTMENTRNDHDLMVQTSDYRLTVRDRVSEDAKFTRSSGKLLALPDLPGSQLVICLENELPSRPKPGEPGVSQSYDPGMSRSNARAETSSLIFAVQGHEFWFSGKQLHTEVKDGKICIWTIFPPSETELMRLER